MPPKKSRGIVIKEKPLNESDKIITVFSEDGKFQAVVNNVRVPRSKLAAGSRLFSWSHFTYFPGKNLAKITEAELIDSFYNIGLDYEKVMYASYILDLVDTFYDEEQLDKKLLKLLVYYLHYLNSKNSSFVLLSLAFQVKLLILNGLSPDFKSLNNLDRDKNIYFSIKNGNFTNVFNKEKNNYQYKLEDDQLDWLIRLYKEPFNNFRINLNKEEEENLYNLMQIFNHFIEYNMSTNIKAFRILKEMKSSENEIKNILIEDS